MILQAKNLSKQFPFKKKILYAVQDVSLTIPEATTVGLVGESGCGKSTLGLMLARLVDPTSGNLEYRGRDLLNFSKQELHEFRRKLQIVFQDPYSSLNPRMTVEEILFEPFKIHKLLSHEERKTKAKELLEQVSLPGFYLERYPHELSGGQRQRIGIARALALSPECIVCDEPISSLDISIQAQIIRLLQKLQSTHKLSYLFISHNLEAVRHIAHQVAVMYLGRIVEEGPTELLYANPLHPYTEALLSAASFSLGKKKEKIVLKGEIPTPFQSPQGCVFASRCPKASAICHLEAPKRKEVQPDHFVSCHLYA